MKRSFRAALIAPLVTPLVYAVMVLPAGFAPGQRRWAAENLPEQVAVIYLFAAPVAYAATFALGCPLLLLLRRLGRLTAIRTILVGALVGEAVAFVLAPYLRGDVFSVPLSGWQGAVLGGITAAAWYWLAYRSWHGRPVP